MKIKVDPEKCSGCHLCEMVCSLYHSGIINTEKSAIHIQKDDLDTSQNTPMLCHQCKEMKCLEGEQVVPHLEKREFIWNKIRAKQCPFDVLRVSGESVYHCDLCGGNPQCIEVCTAKAIILQK